MEKSKWYDNNYKKILLVPLIFLAISSVYLGIFYQREGDIIRKDVSLTGGTTITVIDKEVNIGDLRESLRGEFEEVIVREISEFDTGAQRGFFVETKADPDEIRSTLENYLGYELTSENSSVEFTGSALSEGFYNQLKFAIIIAFLFMGLVVFLIYRTLIPSIAIIISAFGDIVITLAVMNFFGATFSMGGVIAFLMLVGYSVDTDIMLTSRLLRGRQGNEEVNSALYNSLKTGLTMTLTSIVAVGVTLIIIYNLSEVLRQIFTVLLVGLFIDIMNTWLLNAGILKWYVEAKK